MTIFCLEKEECRPSMGLRYKEWLVLDSIDNPKSFLTLVVLVIKKGLQSGSKDHSHLSLYLKTIYNLYAIYIVFKLPRFGSVGRYRWVTTVGL